MTREEHWKSIVDRINLPENEELKNYLLNSEKKGIDIKWYYKKAEMCLKKYQKTSIKEEREYYGINYCTYSRLFLEEMDKQGWK